MKNAVIYARYSSYGQTEQSIEGQIRVCKEFAERNGYNVINIYIDRAMTGTNDNRPAFQQMIEDAKSKTFEAIIVYKLDRFSRNKYDNVVYKHKLAQYGVRVISATEAISDTPEGMMMEGLLEMFAEMYSRELSQKVKRGIRESLLKGNFLGGYAPYGYKVVNKKLVINDEQAKNVKYMFNKYAEGVSKKDIIKYLNDNGYRTNMNKKFTISSFQKALSSTKYIGEITINGETYKNYCPAIIDKQTFEKVQERLKTNRHYSAKGKARDEYLLTGKVFCGYCGASIVGVSGTSHSGKTHNYYACSDRYKKHTCKKKNENKQELELDIVKRIKDLLLVPENIEKIADKLINELNSSSAALKIKEYQKMIQNIERQLDDCCNKLLSTNNSEMLQRIESKANDLTEQKTNYEQQISKLNYTNKLMSSKKVIVDTLNVFIDGDIYDKQYQKRIIDSLVTKVFLFDDKYILYIDLLNINNIEYEKAMEDIEYFDNLTGSNIKCSAPPSRVRLFP